MKEQILKCLANLGVFIDDCDSNSLLRDFIADSVMFISFLVELEQTFGIEISDEYLNPEKLKTLDEVCEMVSIFLNQKGK